MISLLQVSFGRFCVTRGMIVLLFFMPNWGNAKVCEFGVSSSLRQPLTLKNQNGIVFEISKAIADALRCQAQFVVLPRIRLEKSIEQNRVSFICYVSPGWYGKKIDKYIWSPKIFSNPDIVFHKVQTPVPKSSRLDDLPREPIAVAAGYRYFDREGHAQINFVRDDSQGTQVVFNKVHRGRVKYGVMSLVEYSYLLNRLTKEEQKSFAPPRTLNNSEIHCVMNPQSGYTPLEFKQIFTDSFMQKVKKIMQKYRAH